MDLFKDYVTEEDIPSDSMPLTLFFKPTDQGKLAIEATSDSWVQGLPPLQLHFDLRKVYASA